MAKAYLPTRQVHLDFHTSPLIPDMLVDFDPEDFADTFKKAHVNSVTVFAKCHHGMSYYPTDVGAMHPHLNTFDLLGAQLDALKQRNIKTAIYTTVAWEERIASLHPEWRQINLDGRFVQLSARPGVVEPDKWRFLCFNNPQYQAYIESHLQELLDRYETDGYFFDIVFYPQEACFCDHCVPFKEEHNLLEPSSENHARFQEAIKHLFAERMTNFVRSKRPDARTFYNSSHLLGTESNVSIRTMNPYQTHWEIESLPSGFWGYFHFSRIARHVETFNLSWLGMTGRFQRMWGDFGGIKPKEALEYECFRTQGHGGSNSIGDQLPPRGRLEPAAYDLIGHVYQQVEEAEPFYDHSKPLAEVGVLLAGHPSLPTTESSLSEEGAVLMLEEAHYNCHVLDEHSDLKGFKAVVLPDTTVVTERLREKLKTYYEDGGTLLLSYCSGYDVEKNWALDFLPLEIKGHSSMFPTYWRTTETFWPEARSSDRVFYEAGMNVQGGPGTSTLVERVNPYFKRTDSHFMSHFQAPPVATAEENPAVVAGERFVYFSDPLFSGYRRHGTSFYRDVFERTLDLYIGPPLVGKGLARTILSLPRRRGDDLIITLLHYIPLRKSLETEVIEEASSFAGEHLAIQSIPDNTEVRLFRYKALERAGADTFVLPSTRGRLLIEVEGFLKSAAG